MTEHSTPLEITFTLSIDDMPVNLEHIEALLQRVAHREDVSGELGIWLCTDDEIADLHARYLSVDGPTDVITFPGDDDGIGGYLGDIAVSVDTAAEQARDAGHSHGREVAFLCLHGLLHLAGYDDRDPESRDRMIRRQEELLNDFERDNRGTWDRVSAD